MQEQAANAVSAYTAATIMGVIARLPDCAGQAADAASAYQPCQNGGRSKVAQNSKSQSVQIHGYVLHDTNGQTHGQALKIQWFVSNEICTDIHLQASCGRDRSKKFYWDLDGKKYRTGFVCLFIEKQGLC